MTPEQRKRYKELDDDFWKMYNEIKNEGLFEPSPSHIALRIVEVIMLGIIVSFSYYWVQTSNLSPVISTLLSYMIVALGGFFSGRCGFLQHEGGHNSLTGNPKVDDLITKLSIGTKSSYHQSSKSKCLLKSICLC